MNDKDSNYIGTGLESVKNKEICSADVRTSYHGFSYMNLINFFPVQIIFTRSFYVCIWFGRIACMCSSMRQSTCMTWG